MLWERARQSRCGHGIAPTEAAAALSWILRVVCLGLGLAAGSLRSLFPACPACSPLPAAPCCCPIHIYDICTMYDIRYMYDIYEHICGPHGRRLNVAITRARRGLVVVRGAVTDARRSRAALRRPPRCSAFRAFTGRRTQCSCITASRVGATLSRVVCVAPRSMWVPQQPLRLTPQRVFSLRPALTPSCHVRPGWQPRHAAGRPTLGRVAGLGGGARLRATAGGAGGGPGPGA
jgi:hypothetical protein